MQRPPPPGPIDRPALPAHCDAGGCWDNDGDHLRHLGPNPAAPGGPCLQQAGQVLCP